MIGGTVLPVTCVVPGVRRDDGRTWFFFRLRWERDEEVAQLRHRETDCGAYAFTGRRRRSFKSQDNNNIFFVYFFFQAEGGFVFRRYAATTTTTRLRSTDPATALVN